MNARLAILASLTAVMPAVVPGSATAQTGAGTTGAAVLQLPAGGRAAAMGGAYSTGHDVDALFYNPAAAAWQSLSLGIAYQQHVDRIGFTTLAGALAVGPAAVGLVIGYLDYGSVDEVVPDPDFGEQRGIETGRRIDAGELIARAALAAPLLGGRAAVGVATGLLWVSLAETGRVATVFDAGAQYRITADLTLAGTLRNAGRQLSGARLAAVELPTELRAGVRYRVAGLHPAAVLSLHGDLVTPLNDGSAAAAFGAEVSVPTGQDRPTAALRAGYNGTVGPDGVGRFSAGAGLGFPRLDVDYAFQAMGVLGTVHRLGLRWRR